MTSVYAYRRKRWLAEGREVSQPREAPDYPLTSTGLQLTCGLAQSDKTVLDALEIKDSRIIHH